MKSVIRIAKKEVAFIHIKEFLKTLENNIEKFNYLYQVALAVSTPNCKHKFIFSRLEYIAQIHALKKEQGVENPEQWISNIFWLIILEAYFVSTNDQEDLGVSFQHKIMNLRFVSLHTHLRKHKPHLLKLTVDSNNSMLYGDEFYTKIVEVLNENKNEDEDEDDYKIS